MTLPTLPVSTARLPAAYENAKEALAKCERLDECLDWADKMAAMASYARQSEDDSLEKMAMRVRARAIRRCGELLREIRPTPMAERPRKQGEPPPPVSRTQAAREVGMSDDQRKQALRVAAIPEPDFEAAITSDDPPTLTELAERGTKPAPKPLIDLGGRSPNDFKAATRAQGMLCEFAAFTTEADLAAIVRGSDDDERAAMANEARVVSEWLNQLLDSLEGTR